MHGEWLRCAKSTSQYLLAFSLKFRDDSLIHECLQVNALCRHNITRSDRQIGNDTIKKFVRVLLVIMGLLLVIIETVMDPVGL